MFGISVLGQPIALVAAGLAAGLAFLLWFAVGRAGNPSRGAVLGVEFLSLPIGVFAFVTAVVAALSSSVPIYLWAILAIAGAVLVGKSMQDLPWVGVGSLAVGVATWYVIRSYLPAATPWEVPLAVAGIAVVLAYVILALVGGAFKLVALVAVPRIVSLILGLASIAAGLIEAFGMPGGIP